MKAHIEITLCTFLMIIFITGCGGRTPSGVHKSKKTNSPKALVAEASGIGYDVEPAAVTLADDLNWEASFENDCSESTLKSELPDKKLFYIHGHGNDPFTGIIFGSLLNPTSIFKPSEVPSKVGCILVFLNGCKTLDNSQGTVDDFIAKFKIAEVPFTYIGNETTIISAKSSKFGKDFFIELDHSTPVDVALDRTKTKHNQVTAVAFYGIFPGTDKTQVIDR